MNGNYLTQLLGRGSSHGMVLLLAVSLLGSGCGLLGTRGGEETSAAIPRAPSTWSTPGDLPAAPGNLDTLGLVAYAASMQGKPYRVAGDSPSEGFDCSGLVQHVFGQFDLYLPRDTASMAEFLPAISLSEVQAADLLFFNTQGRPFSHVGIYLGDGRFVHAPSPRTGRVIISAVDNHYWRNRVTGARRPAPVTYALSSREGGVARTR
ncbi:MAG: NlpC/P60 family protein [Gammaproteobacteria bacterium]|nr:NlpC/P60 family protein [Gammaproteobacteria bacterium]